MSHFETFFVPPHHFKLFLKSLNVSVDVTDLNMLLTSDYQANCKVGGSRISLLDQLIVPIKGLTEALVDISSQ